MAFNNRGLSVIAYANGFTFWHYKSEDTLETIFENKYFNNINTLVESGDIIIINGSNGASIKCIKMNGKDVSLAKIKF